MVAERALETQQNALLRLLARWLAFFEFVSGGPFAVPLPRWVRAFFDTLLIRAELAAQYLLIASASIQARRSGLVFEGFKANKVSRLENRISVLSHKDAVPSSAGLRRRMIALRTLLKNLRGEARRLMQKRSDRRALGGRKSTWASRRSCHRVGLCDGPQAKRRWLAERIDRPPDKD